MRFSALGFSRGQILNRIRFFSVVESNPSVNGQYGTDLAKLRLLIRKNGKFLFVYFVTFFFKNALAYKDSL
jgi:hypothetical protein